MERLFVTTQENVTSAMICYHFIVSKPGKNL